MGPEGLETHKRQGETNPGFRHCGLSIPVPNGKRGIREGTEKGDRAGFQGFPEACSAPSKQIQQNLSDLPNSKLVPWQALAEANKSYKFLQPLGCHSKRYHSYGYGSTQTSFIFKMQHNGEQIVRQGPATLTFREKERLP